MNARSGVPLLRTPDDPLRFATPICGGWGVAAQGVGLCGPVASPNVSIGPARFSEVGTPQVHDLAK